MHGKDINPFRAYFTHQKYRILDDFAHCKIRCMQIIYVNKLYICINYSIYLNRNKVAC